MSIHLCPGCGQRCTAPQLFEGWHPTCAPEAVAERVRARLIAADRAEQQAQAEREARESGRRYAA